jgi:REP element-mobilizing transposase RayT
MPRRDHKFAIDEYYHCYNRGTDKRIIFNDAQDFSYFIKSLKAYNTTESLGKLRLSTRDGKKITEIIAYALLPNHFHLVLKEVVDGGISKLLQRTGIGYTMYFNQKYKRSGTLFQGSFKSKHIENDQDLRQVCAYVSNNNLIHAVYDSTKYRSELNKDATLVRDPYSNLSTEQLLEIAEIIKEQRLSFKEI